MAALSAGFINEALDKLGPPCSRVPIEEFDFQAFGEWSFTLSHATDLGYTPMDATVCADEDGAPRVAASLLRNDQGAEMVLLAMPFESSAVLVRLDEAQDSVVFFGRLGGVRITNGELPHVIDVDATGNDLEEGQRFPRLIDPENCGNPYALRRKCRRDCGANPADCFGTGIAYAGGAVGVGGLGGPGGLTAGAVVGAVLGVGGTLAETVSLSRATRNCVNKEFEPFDGNECNAEGTGAHPDCATKGKCAKGWCQVVGVKRKKGTPCRLGANHDKPLQFCRKLSDLGPPQRDAAVTGECSLGFCYSRYEYCKIGEACYRSSEEEVGCSKHCGNGIVEAKYAEACDDCDASSTVPCTGGTTCSAEQSEICAADCSRCLEPCETAENCEDGYCDDDVDRRCERESMLGPCMCVEDAPSVIYEMAYHFSHEELLEGEGDEFSFRQASSTLQSQAFNDSVTFTVEFESELGHASLRGGVSGFIYNPDSELETTGPSRASHAAHLYVWVAGGADDLVEISGSVTLGQTIPQKCYSVVSTADGSIDGSAWQLGPGTIEQLTIDGVTKVFPPWPETIYSYVGTIGMQSAIGSIAVRPFVSCDTLSAIEVHTDVQPFVSRR